MEVGLFEWYRQPFALPFDGLRCVLGTPASYPLPLIGMWFSGVVIEQGRIIPCFDLGRWLHDGTCGFPETWFCAVYATEFGEIGIPATHVVGLMPKGSGAKNAADDAGKMLGASEVFSAKGRDFPILDIEMMIRSMTCA